MSSDKSTPVHTAQPAPAQPMFGTVQAPKAVSVSAAAAQNKELHHRRRMSIGTISTAFPFPGSGASGLGPQSPATAGGAFGGSVPPVSGPAAWVRRGSISSSLASDESAIDESTDLAGVPPTTPLTRRLSAGTNVFRGFRPPGPSSPTSVEGFNFAENFRTRAERASMSSAAGLPSYPAFGHRRRASMATPTAADVSALAAVRSAAVAPAPAARPASPPRPPQGLTDPIQERILKGDFYMD